MNAAQSLAVLIIASSLAACTETPPPGPSGAELLAPFKSELQQALKAGLSEGPVQAIDTCRIQAPRIAASLSTGGVALGRTSHKLRNPENVAPPWAMAILDEYLAIPGTRQAVTRSIGNGRKGRVEPIITQPLCLACHGETISPDVAEAISSIYPDDQATGFAVGDLRGIFWVEYPDRR